MYMVMYILLRSRVSYMAPKVRKQIYLDPEQEAILKQVAKDTGVSEAEVIRQAIERYSKALTYPQRDLSAWEQERAFIQKLIDRGPVSGKRTWRREDLYER